MKRLSFAIITLGLLSFGAVVPGHAMGPRAPQSQQSSPPQTPEAQQQATERSTLSGGTVSGDAENKLNQQIDSVTNNSDNSQQ
jgi:hypothetical protein